MNEHTERSQQAAGDEKETPKEVRVEKHVQDLTETGFEAAVDGQPAVVIEFWSPTCAPCRVLAPLFEKITAEVGVPAYKMDTRDEQNMGPVGGLEIRSTPTIIFFQNGQEVDRTIGIVPAHKLRELLNKIKPADNAEST